MRPSNIRNPKQTNGHKDTERRRWYPYYAGYTEAFVDDALVRLEIEPGMHVLDPWNGAGTTTTRAALAGCEATGIDVNPVLALVARGRLVGATVADSLEALTEEIIDVADESAVDVEADPLRDWYKRPAATHLRGFEHAIQRMFVSHDDYAYLRRRGLSEVSSLAAFMYVVLFRTVRCLLSARRTSNPTWFRKPKSSNQKEAPASKTIANYFRSECRALAAYARASCLHEQHAGKVALVVDNSENTKLGTRFDCLLGSPPYCTRIDYAIATAPELAVLGYGQQDISELRQLMMGSPTVYEESFEEDRVWGATTKAILRAVKCHDSKASATYYYKYYYQYFKRLYATMQNLSSQANDEAKMCMVVQDSYYKNVHVPLQEAVMEAAEQCGWSRNGLVSFDALRNMSALNPHARKNREKFRAVESVLFFSRHS
jgi:hypothetical protein